MSAPTESIFVFQKPSVYCHLQYDCVCVCARARTLLAASCLGYARLLGDKNKMIMLLITKSIIK